MKTFSFPENSISEKYLFSGNAFTRTKRSLKKKKKKLEGNNIIPSPVPKEQN